MIRLADEFGPALTGRTVGIQLRERIERAAERGETIVVDFDGVEALSPSFADEIFARVPVELIDSGRVRFENLAGDLLEVARFFTSGRQA